jgi:hypothetical protein
MRRNHRNPIGANLAGQQKGFKKVWPMFPIGNGIIIIGRNIHANSLDRIILPKMIALFRLQQQVVENFLIAEVPCCDRGVAQGSTKIRV